jgi:AraC-like DNA-binding protein
MFIAGNEQSWIFKKAGLDRTVSHLHIPNVSRFSRILEQIVATYSEGTYSPLYPSWSVMELLDSLCSSRYGDSPGDAHLGDRLRQLIDSSPVASPSVQELANTLGIDRSTAYRAFRCKYGLSIKEYIEENRMDRAQSFLLYSPSSIKEIAWMLGYADWRQFSKTFRNRLGTSPSQWRSAHDAYSSTRCSMERDFS